MDIKEIEGVTRRIGKPANWVNEVHGECASLPVRDVTENGRNIMWSQWTFTDEERKAIAEGADIFLGVHGVVHPVVCMGVEDKAHA